MGLRSGCVASRSLAQAQALAQARLCCCLFQPLLRPTRYARECPGWGVIGVTPQHRTPPQLDWLSIDHNSPTAGKPWLPRISAAPFAADMNSHAAFGP